jgi:hypothetical protein
MAEVTGERLHVCGETGFEAVLLRETGPERERLERELLAAGVFLPLLHRVDWARAVAEASWFVGVRDDTGRWRGGFAVEVAPSRALPGHRLLRVTRLGAGLPGPTLRVGLAALAALAGKEPRILRVTVHAFSRSSLGEIGATLSDLSFQEIRPPSSYEHTLVLDLSRDLEATLGALHKSARRNIREIAKGPVDVVPITEVRWAPRIAELQNLALRRTGAREGDVDWEARINLSRTRPDASNLVGLFRREIQGPESLVAFAWGCHHGDHVEYHSGGSTRLTDLRLALAYGPLWELISWAKQEGATWFDLGGVTLESSATDGDDALEGISRFKGYFSRDVAQVGAEWRLEPHPARAKLARSLSGAAAWLRGRLRPAPP